MAAMAMTADEIAALIREGITGAVVKIEDLAGDGEHYAAHITAPAFKGLSKIQQHQMVYKALQGKMGKDLHALAIQTAAPVE
jgi:stress-induced morphogen